MRYLHYLTVIGILIYTSCTENEAVKIKKVEKFEKNYRKYLDEFTDSLMRIKELDTNYFIELSPRNNNKLFFWYYTDDNKRGSLFDVNYTLSKEQINVFNEIILGDISFKKKDKVFFCKPFYFKNNNATLLLLIDKDTFTKSQKIIENPLFYKKGNYEYYLADAWK